MRSLSEPDRLPSDVELCAVIWSHLDAHPDCRPSQTGIARALGIEPRRLRRAWHCAGRTPVRTMITRACLLYALWLIYNHHCKAVAAVRVAGFRSYWNANRQFKRYTGYTFGQCRDTLPLGLDIRSFLAKLNALHSP